MNAILLTGCSGGGKSTLLEALAAAGQAVVEEPGRRVIARARSENGTAMPWIDMAAFLRAVLAQARDDLDGRPATRRFFDRGLIDAAVAWQHLTGTSAAALLRDAPRYASRVFVAPPWPALFAADENRRHDLAAADDEYRRIVAALPALGYEAVELPRVSVAERVAFVLSRSPAG